MLGLILGSQSLVESHFYNLKHKLGYERRRPAGEFFQDSRFYRKASQRADTSRAERIAQAISKWGLSSERRAKSVRNPIFDLSRMALS
jgi:hypothetical protein